MASYQRIALYAIFDAIERDLIQFIRHSLSPSGIQLTEDEATKARNRIIKRHREGLYNLDDAFDLLHGLDLGDKFSILLRYKTDLSHADSKYFKGLKQLFDRAIPVRNDIMHGRPLTVDDYALGFALGNDLNKRPDIWRELSSSLSEMNNKPEAIISKAVLLLDDERSSAVLHNLPKADYDDTGFMPRQKLENDLKNKILGRHPVITVLGDGGNGKTALMLQTAYRLVYSQDHDFDAIIWVTAKSSQLTTKEIRRISDAITSSIEVFEQVAEFEPGDDNPMQRVRRLLEQNKVLLIIDNLETVLDPLMREFSEDIPGQSKLVFTSRVPLGSDLSLKVNSFSEAESETYLRRLIDAYDIKSLRNVSKELIKKHLKILNYKPLLIKWFALGVLSGLSPESITRNPEIALRFCLENVIEALSSQAKRVAIAFATIPGSHPAIILQHLTELPSEDVEASIATLLTYGLIEDDSKDPYERTYSMPSFAKSYLSRIEKTQNTVIEAIRERNAKLQNVFQLKRAETSVSRYIPAHYTVRSKAEAVAVTKLAQAFRLSEFREFDRAKEIINELLIVSPRYFEIYRVAAYIYAESGEISEAESLYETAIEIDSTQPQLYYWYAGFVMRNQNDFYRTSNLFEKALEIDPNSGTVLREAARNELIVPDFVKAQDLLDRAQNVDTRTHKDSIILCDLQAQLYIRKAYALNHSGDYCGAVESLETLRRYVESLSSSLIDSKFIDHISRVRHYCLNSLENKAPLDLKERITEFSLWLNTCTKVPSEPSYILQNTISEKDTSSKSNWDFEKVYIGKQKLSGKKPSFCFLITDDGEVFLHRSTVSSEIWNLVESGVDVRFRIVKPKPGRENPSAIDVELVSGMKEYVSDD